MFESMWLHFENHPAQYSQASTTAFVEQQRPLLTERTEGLSINPILASSRTQGRSLSQLYSFDEGRVQPGQSIRSSQSHAARDKEPIESSPVRLTCLFLSRGNKKEDNLCKHRTQNTKTSHRNALGMECFPQKELKVESLKQKTKNKTKCQKTTKITQKRWHAKCPTMSNVKRRKKTDRDCDTWILLHWDEGFRKK